MTKPRLRTAELGWRFGIADGSLLSSWMVVSSLVFLVNERWNHSDGRVIAALYHPLAFNNLVEYALVYAALFLSPVLPGIRIRRHGGTISDAALAGIVASALIFSATAIAGYIRMNIVLEIIRNRPAWQQALVHFAGSRSILAQANLYYVTQVPERLLIGVISGAVVGALGGVIGTRHTQNRVALVE